MCGVPQIFVATPLGKNGMLHIDTASFCAGVARHPNVVWGQTSTMSPESSRNVLVERRLREDQGSTTHFLFVDSDVVIPPEALTAMLGHGAAIVTAPCPIYFNGRLVWNVANAEGGWWPITRKLTDTPFLTKKTGFGCVLIQREVLEKMGWPWFHMEFQPMGESNKILKTGEDIWFCQRAQTLGYDILCDPSIICDHWNQVKLMQFYTDIFDQLQQERMEHRSGNHLAVLEKVLNHTIGPIIELGCGAGSTPYLNRMAGVMGRTVTSYENNPDYFNQYLHLNDRNHQIKFVRDWNDLPTQRCGVLFVDNAPCEARVPLIERFTESADVIVVHDTEDRKNPYGWNGTFKHFKYQYTNDQEPQTTVVSNNTDLDFLLRS